MRTLRSIPPLLLLCALLGCGSEAPSPTAGDAGRDGVVVGDLPTSGNTGRVRVRVTYGGQVMTNAQLQISASRERMSTAPPEGYAVVKDPTFPASGELVFATAGSYWVTANLNAPPVLFQPGPEDRVGATAAAVDVRLGATQDVTIELLDRDL